MIIGIDIDNTVIKSNNPFYIFLNKIFERTPKIIVKKKYKMIKSKNITRTILNKLSVLNDKNYKLINNSKNAINKLSEKHIIYFVSSRPSFKAIKYLTVKNFEKFGIKYDIIFLSCQNKYQICKDKNIDVFVDNSPFQCNTIANKTNTKAILFCETSNSKAQEHNSQMNSKITNDDVLCLDNWNDIFEYVNYVYPILKTQKTPYNQEYLNNLKNAYKNYKFNNTFSKNINLAEKEINNFEF